MNHFNTNKHDNLVVMGTSQQHCRSADENSNQSDGQYKQQEMFDDQHNQGVVDEDDLQRYYSNEEMNTSSGCADISLERKLDRLNDLEKQFAVEQLYKEDQNRDFVIQEAQNFLFCLPETKVADQKQPLIDDSMDSDANLNKDKEKEMIYLADAGRQPGQSVLDWENTILKGAFKKSNRIFLTRETPLGNNLKSIRSRAYQHPIVAMSMLPYQGQAARIDSSSDSSSENTFSSSETSQSAESIQSSYSSDTISSRRESFEMLDDAPKCHRGHIHLIQNRQNTNLVHRMLKEKSGNV